MNKNKTNLSVVNAAGIRINPNIIVGDQGSFSSGDILDANATEELVVQKLDDIVDGASDALNTLNEIGNAIPTKVSQLDNDAGYISDISGKTDKVASATSGNFAGLDSNGNLTDSGKSASDFATATQGSKVDAIDGMIPTQASSENQLADKSFVNSSVATNTANFKGTYTMSTDLSNSISNLGTAITAAGHSAPDNNDYCFVVTTDAAGNTVYNRYKYTVTNNVGAWDFEYALNNSSFTSEQWTSISSGITSNLVTKLSNLPTNSELTTSLSGKQGTLVAGTDIKNINNSSILASGNLNLVESDDVRHIVVLTQSEYEQLGTKDVNTEYNII